MSVRFLLNQQIIAADGLPQDLLLDFIRNNRHLTGSKEACREGDCGACQILLGHSIDGRLRYQAVNACLLPLAAVAGCHLVTVEGLSVDTLNPIQQALVDGGAIQCGFCTPGLVVALTGFFLNAAASDAAEALDAVAGNLCRCTGYAGIKRAIAGLCAEFDLSASSRDNRVEDLLAWRMLPPYFAGIAATLSGLPPLPAQPMDDALLIAGGTDVFVRRPSALNSQPLQFLTRDHGTPCIRREKDHYRIEALTTLEQFRTSSLLQQHFANLSEDFKLICSAPVRQRATVGGNLVNASPIADLAVFLLALDSELTIASASQTRSVALRDFFKAYKQIDLHAGERLLDIRFKIPPPDARFSAEKVGKRRHLDIASVNSALSIEAEDGRIISAHLAAGGVTPVPLYLAETSRYLQGQSLNMATLKNAAKIAQREIAPIDDIRGSASYKRLLLQQLLYAHFFKCFPETFAGEDFDAEP